MVDVNKSLETIETNLVTLVDNFEELSVANAENVLFKGTELKKRIETVIQSVQGLRAQATFDVKKDIGLLSQLESDLGQIITALKNHKDSESYLAKLEKDKDQLVSFIQTEMKVA